MANAKIQQKSVSHGVMDIKWLYESIGISCNLRLLHSSNYNVSNCSYTHPNIYGRSLTAVEHSRSHLKIEFFLLFIVNIDESWSFICFYWVDAMKSSWIMSLIRFANRNYLFLPFIWFDHSKIQNHWLKLNIVERKIAFWWRLKHQSFQISTFLNVISHLIFFIFFYFFLCLQTLIIGYNLVRNAWTHWIALCVYEFWCVHAFADTNFDLKLHAFSLTNWCRNCPLLSDAPMTNSVQTYAQINVSNDENNTQNKHSKNQKSAHKTRTQDLESDLDDLNCLKSLFGEFFGK